MPNRPYLGRMVDDAIAMFKPHVSGTEGAVSANNPYAAEAGLEILKAGGNAFDAACAISLVLGVVEPYHSGIGGGGRCRRRSVPGLHLRGSLYRK